MEHLKWNRIMLLAILAICLFLFFYFDLQDYLTFEYLKTNRDMLSTSVSNHPFLSAVIFLAIYAAATAISAPGAIFITMAGGFLFGTILGSVLVVIGATLGATAIFYVAKTSLHDFFYHKTGNWYKKIADGFKKNAVSYLLFLRLVPLFPFWVINIVPGLFGIHTLTFMWTTFLGIIPGTVAYASLGAGLDSIFEQDQTLNLKLIFEPQILFPLIALALLSLVPIIYEKLKKRGN